MTEVIEEGENGSPVVSERVQSLAQGIYEELQSMVDFYGQESIGNLMPLVVNVLENLDSALSDNKDHMTAIEDFTHTNELLMKQYEKEKQRRKEVEEKAMLQEDANEQELREIKEQLSRVSLENQNLSSKVKNQKEQIDRLEDKNENIKRENSELHNKYIDKVKEFTGKIDALKVAKLAAESRKAAEDMSPVTKIGGFQDFTVPSKAASKKKRHLPIAPRRRDTASSQDDQDDDMFLGTTPANRPDSPEYVGTQLPQFAANYRSLHEEQLQEEAEVEDEERTPSPEEDPALRQFGEEVANEENLLAELQTASGIDQIITENEKLITDKNELSREVEELLSQLRDTQSHIEVTESSLAAVKEEKESLVSKVGELEGTVKKLNKDLEEEREKETQVGGVDGLSRIEVARVLRERNEFKEKYLSLLEQIRMSDELSLFKSKSKKSRWVDYFAALFSPAKRRQMETQDSTPRRAPILGRHSPGRELDEDDGGVPLAMAAGYCNTGVIPVLRKTGRKQDELYMTSVSWVIPALMDHHGTTTADGSPNINTCRPMTYQEDGAKVLCAAAVNPAMFMEDHRSAVAVLKSPTPIPDSKPENFSTSLLWVVSGTMTLTKVSVIDAAAMGEALDTFTVCASPIHCIATVPGFNENDPDVLTSLSTARKKSIPIEVQSTLNDRPSSKFATMWMGSETGELYVHSAVSMWKKCIHADKLPAAIKDITYMKGKVFIFLGNANLAVFRRFPDGDWDWYNYSRVVLEAAKRHDLKCTCLAAVHFNVWCAIGNMIHVVHSHLLKKESTFSVHHGKKAEVSHMVPVGDGVWISFKYDSTLRLFHGTTLTCMQDLDIGPSVQRILAFGSERRMPIQVSTLIPAHNALWVGTENGVLLSFPFTVPTMVAEEAGWEFIKEAEVGGTVVPEPFDVRTEHAVEARMLTFDGAAEVGSELGVTEGGGGSSESPLPPSAATATTSQTQSQQQLKQMEAADVPKKLFNPFCSVDGMQLSIHCHINSVKTLLCVPGQIPKDPSVYEPLGGVLIGVEDRNEMKPALFVVSCGEGHLDLRTADKVMQTLIAKDAGQSGLPSPATIISEKNYIIVWELNSS